ncbi:fimbrial protein [Shewanella chilikensis]|uniref:fimbrial protein n=1 Tax=Shewanella chilikensis TaxID=558541 RepID=UPI00399B024B
MNNIQKFIGIFFIFLSLVMQPKMVEAVDCSRTSNFIDSQMPLAVNNLTVNPDMPNGTVIFKQNFLSGQTLSAYCNASNISYQAYIEHSYSSRPYSASPWKGGPYPQATIYQTGVPGIGVMMAANNSPFPSDKKFKTPTQENINRDYRYNNSHITLLLIKTGNVRPGTIRGMNLPTGIIRFKAPGTNFLWARVKIQGTINIVSQTCNVSNVNVPMGQHKIGDKLTTTGATTGWVDASIRLTNCPRFYGTLNDGNNTYYNYTTGASNTGTYTKNILGVSISPNTSIIDNSQGIMSIKSTTNSAKGVAIQLAEFSNGFNQYIKFGNLLNYTLLNNNRTTFTIPLKARYIQTESKVTPGRADATATFTLTYK